MSLKDWIISVIGLKKKRKSKIKWRLLRNNIIITTPWCSLLSRFHRFRGHTRRGNDSRRSWLASAIVFPASTATRRSVICSSNSPIWTEMERVPYPSRERNVKKNFNLFLFLSLSLFFLQFKIKFEANNNSRDREILM